MAFNNDGEGMGRDIQQDSPVDAYMQSLSTQTFPMYEPFYYGHNDHLELHDINSGQHATVKPDLLKPVVNPAPPSAGCAKAFDVVVPNTPGSKTGLNSKVDQYINSILAEGTDTRSRPVDHAEIVSFLDSQFRVALDPLLISSIASVPVVSDKVSLSGNPKPKKKRKQSALQELEPEIERELTKYPEEEREKQRKILKNRLAARTFRRRQKEHISEMTMQIDSLTDENAKLRSALKLMAMENKMVKEQLGYIKSFLTPMGGVTPPAEVRLPSAADVRPTPAGIDYLSTSQRVSDYVLPVARFSSQHQHQQYHSHSNSVTNYRQLGGYPSSHGHYSSSYADAHPFVGPGVAGAGGVGFPAADHLSDKGGLHQPADAYFNPETL